MINVVVKAFKQYKFLVAICIMVFFSNMAFAQSMSVASFRLDEKDHTANIKGSVEYDLNGEKCALIKIETTQRGFVFDTGFHGITKVVEQNDEHPGEIWLYIPYGVNKLSIQHPQLGIIRDYDLGLRVQKGKTYILQLTTDQVNTMIVDYNNSQYLVFDIHPSNATVYINGIPIEFKNGSRETNLPFGTHNYRITAPKYHTVEGQVKINDKDNKQKLSLHLKPAFGFLNVSSLSDEFAGADVFVDNSHVGKTPLLNFQLESGAHKVRIQKKLYKSYTHDVEMTDSAVVNVNPSLEPNYANVTLTVGNNADIYDGGLFLGTGKWQGRLEAGKHIIEARKENHRATKKEMTVVRGRKQEIQLDAPQPIYGLIEVSSSPSGADVYIDGKKAGTTPLVKSRVLVGEYNIEIRKLNSLRC